MYTGYAGQSACYVTRAGNDVVTTDGDAAAVARNEEASVRLRWYEAELYRTGRNGDLSWAERRREESLSMRRPKSAQEAFALFGTLLGLLPPAAILYRIFGGRLALTDFDGLLLLLCLMNAVCVVVGGRMGFELGLRVDALERERWLSMFPKAMLLGFLWALITGAAGGAAFFGFGAFFAATCAVPVGVPAFALFISLHRLIARGGMIEARHLLPLSYGIAGFICALILSPHAFPY